MQSLGLLVRRAAADAGECTGAHESPSAAEFDTDVEPSCLGAIDPPSSHTFTYSVRIRPLPPSPPRCLSLRSGSIFISHPLILQQTAQTTSHNEVALHHDKHCCVSKWAGEEAGSISALFPNYLLQAAHRWGQWEGVRRRRERMPE